MSLQTSIMSAMKEAMKAKDQNALTSLRAIKSEILKAQTETGSKKEISEDSENWVDERQEDIIKKTNWN